MALNSSPHYPAQRRFLGRGAEPEISPSLWQEEVQEGGWRQCGIYGCGGNRRLGCRAEKGRKENPALVPLCGYRTALANSPKRSALRLQALARG